MFADDYSFEASLVGLKARVMMVLAKIKDG